MNTRPLVIASAVAVLSGSTLMYGGSQAPAPQATSAVQAAATPAITPGSARDFSGIWMVVYTGYRETRSAPMTPWAQTLFKERAAAEDPGAQCLLPGVPRDMGAPYPMEIVQTPGVLYVLHEYQHMIRRILIGAEHPVDPDPSFMGHSIARWEGDTLVVDTIGRNDRTWLAPTGVPHSDQLHVIERIATVPSADGKTRTLRIVTEIDDPKAFTKRWTMTNNYNPRPDMQIMEYICQENNRAITK